MLPGQLVEFAQQLAERYRLMTCSPSGSGTRACHTPNPPSPMITSGCAVRNAWRRSTWSGSEPSHQAPDQRAAWHQAFAAFSPASQPDVRAMPDGRLWLTRGTYAAQTAWAPRHVGKELRLSQLGAFDAALGVIRADAEADAARKNR